MKKILCTLMVFLLVFSMYGCDSAVDLEEAVIGKWVCDDTYIEIYPGGTTDDDHTTWEIKNDVLVIYQEGYTISGRPDAMFEAFRADSHIQSRRSSYKIDVTSTPYRLISFSDEETVYVKSE